MFGKVLGLINTVTLSLLQKSKLSVTPGEIYKEAPWEKTKQEKQEYRLREKMVKRKYRNLYKSMMRGRKEREKEAWLLNKKRKQHDEQQKQEKTLKKKQTKIVDVIKKNSKNAAKI